MSFLDSLKGLFGPTNVNQSSGRIDVEARFERSRTAATGTMSHFFVARDRQRKEDVGVKLLDPEKYELFESRFKGLGKPTEGEIAMSMHHPKIVKTYEHGVSTKGERVIIMEYIGGHSLQDLIVRKRSNIVAGHEIMMMRDMAEALDYVHSQNYIHRDVCPRNFITTPEVDMVKMIDFGLTVPATAAFMAPGNRTGTPLYMSPEIVRRRKTDRRVDIFSLGVTFYCLLTMSHPWQGEIVTGRAALTHDTQPPTDILERRPELNPKLGRAIMRMIHPDVDQRMATVGDFLNQIQTMKVVDAE